MSITATNPISGHAIAGYGTDAIPRDGHGAADSVNAFSAYGAPKAALQDTTAFDQNGISLLRNGAYATPSPDTARLHDNARLIDRARGELKTLAYRLRNDPSLGPKSEAAKRVGAARATFDFVIAETKKSGLYGALQQAAVQRLKDSGKYESLINQVLQQEQAQGRTHDRTWAENWIERQYDVDCVDRDFVPGAFYFDAAHGFADVEVLDRNTGAAAFHGDKTNVEVNGSFRINIGGNANALSYTVTNFGTGETTAPRPYDARGTVIKTDGLRAELIGTPAPGDGFHVENSWRYSPSSGHDVLAIDPFYLDAGSKRARKNDLFNTLFDPAIRGRGASSPYDVIRNAI